MSAYPSSTTDIFGATGEFVVAKSQGVAVPFVIERTFDLDALLATKVANADIVNLFSLPANHTILATLIKTDVVAVGCSSTCTAKLRIGTTDIGAATSILSTATGTGGGATVSLPLNNGTSATLVNLVFAIGAGTTTTNPTITVRMLVCDMG